MTCNKNGVPFDTAPFTVTSGVRLGTPAGTTRGFGVEEFQQIGHWIADVVDLDERRRRGRSGRDRRGRGPGARS